MTLRTRILTLLIVFLTAANVSAQVATNTTGNNGSHNGGTTTSVSWNFDPVGAGCTNCALIVQLEGDSSADDVTGVTFDTTQNMTFIDKSHASGGRWTYTYGLLNPHSGSHAIVATIATTHYIFGVAVSYSGVTGFGAHTNTSCSSVTSCSGSLTTTAANSWIYLGAAGSNVSSWTGTSNAVLRGVGPFSSPVIFDNNTAVATGSHSMTIDAGATGDIGIVMVELQAGAPPPSSPQYVTAASAGSSGASSVTTGSFTVSGTNRYLACALVTQDTTKTGTSVTMSNGSTALTQRQTRDFDNGGVQARAEMWDVVAPPTGSTTVTANVSATTAVALGCVQLENVDQTTPRGTFVTAGASSNHPSVAVSSATNDLVMDFLSVRTGTTGITEGSGQTNRVELQSGSGVGNVTVGMSTEAGASSVTMDWTVDDSTSKSWSTIGVSIHPPGSGGGGTPPTITTTSPLTSGTQGTAYSVTFAATGGTTPYTWTQTTGALPSGLTLSSGGVLSGTPTGSGTYTFSIRATGADTAYDEDSFSVTIGCSAGTRKVYTGGTSASGDTTYTNSQAQQALNDACPGDHIYFENGYTYNQTLVLPVKGCAANNDSCYITISGGIDSSGTLAGTYPAAGIRIIPPNAEDGFGNPLTPNVSSADLPKFVATVNNDPALRTVYPGETGSGLCSVANCVATYWKIENMEFPNFAPWNAGAIVVLGTNHAPSDLPGGNGQDQEVKIPHHFILDHVWIHGDRVDGQSRCMTNAAKYTTVRNSFIDDCFSVQEIQAISALNSTGYQTYTNNYMAASGETFFTGGADPYGQFNATVLASPAPTTTSAHISNCQEFGTSVDKQWFTIEVGGQEYERRINTIDTSTCNITWLDPLPAPPDQPGDADNVHWTWPFYYLDAEKNYVTKKIRWRSPYLSQPTGLSAKVTGTGGTLAAGTNFYVVQARQNTTNSIMVQSTTTAEVSAVTTGSTSKVDLSWNPTTNADEYYVFWRLGNATRLLATVTSPSYSHTSPTAGTAVNGTVQDATATPNTSSGSLPAGTYYYRIEARPASTLPPSPVVTCVLPSTGKCDLSWSAVTGASNYRVWKGGNGTVVQSQSKWLCTSTTCGSPNFYTTTGTTFSDSVYPGTQGTNYVNEDIYPGDTPTVPAVKNTFELKNCTHCIVKGNYIENSWVQGQIGMVVNIKTNNQDGSDDSGTISDVDISYNIIKNGTRAIQACAMDCDGKGSGVADNIRIRHNLMYNIDASWGGQFSAISLTSGYFAGQPSNRGGQQFTFDHNTILESATDSYPLLIEGTTAGVFPTWQWTDMKWTNNIARRGQFGWHAIYNGSFGGTSNEGTGGWNLVVDGTARQMAKNVWQGATCVSYPDTPNNFCPVTEAEFEGNFNNWAAGDYSLAPSSPWKGQGTDGLDLGVDWVTLKALTDVAISGNDSVGGTSGGSSDFKIEAEDYNSGGEGVAYHDTDTGNNGGAYRSDDVDIEAMSGGGYDVGWAFAGEWLKYTHAVATTGTYTLTFRVSSAGSGGTFHLEVDGTDVTGALTVPDTGAWTTFTTVTKTGVSLTVGASRVFRLVMDTNGATTAVGNFDWFNVALASSNSAPVVNAGTDQSASTPTPTVNLDGTVSDDGLPNPPATVTTTWSVTSQPGGGSVTFGNANAVDTTATFNNTTGTYVLRLTASDSVLTTYDEMSVTISTPSNTPPTVNAGTDKTTTMPAGIALTGSASDDGLPNPPGALTLTWSKVSGPGTVTFLDSHAAITTASFSIDGTYVLRLSANDGAATTTDDMTATVLPAAASSITVRADRFLFNNGSCYMRSGAGPLTLSGCDTYIDSSTGRLYTQEFSTNTLASTGDLTLDVAGKDILPRFGYDTNLGSLQKKFLTLHAAELWVETLVAQNTIATIGGRVLVAPTTYLTADLTNSATTIQVKHNNFINGDTVYMEANGQVEFFRITSNYSGTAGAYIYSVTRNLDGSGANNWSSGDAMVSVSKSFIDIYSTRGVKAGTEIGPTMVGNCRKSTVFNDWAPCWALGNLNGLHGYGTDTMGAAFGDPTGAWIVIEPIYGLRMGHGIIGAGGANSVVIDPAGNASFTGTITSTAGNIGGFTITSNYLYTGSGTTRSGISSDGSIAFWAGSDAPPFPFSVSSHGILTAFGVNVSGNINATSGSFTGTITAATMSGSTITGTTISGNTISGNTITGGSISGSTVSGNTITGGTISGTTITGSTLQAGGSGGDVTVDSSGITISAGTGASQKIKWSNSSQIAAASSYIEVFGTSQVRMTTGAGSMTLGSGELQPDSGLTFGDSSHKWGDMWIQGDMHQTPADTTAGDLPIVYSISNGIYYKKTNGYSGTCSSPTSIVIQNGIVVGCS